MDSDLARIDVEREIADFLKDEQRRGESSSDVLRRLLKLPRGKRYGRAMALLAHMAERGLTPEATATQRYLVALGSLYIMNRVRFRQVVNLRFGRRPYFARTSEEIVGPGLRRTKWPQQIPGSPFWTLTNLNAERKGTVVEGVMVQLGYGVEVRARVLAALSGEIVRQGGTPQRNP